MCCTYGSYWYSTEKCTAGKNHVLPMANRVSLTRIATTAAVVEHTMVTAQFAVVIVYLTDQSAPISELVPNVAVITNFMMILHSQLETIHIGTQQKDQWNVVMSAVGRMVKIAFLDTIVTIVVTGSVATVPVNVVVENVS
jgi:hypothetical protein